jgi:hypothetical protein
MAPNQKEGVPKHVLKIALKIVFILAGCLLVFYFFLLPPIVKSYLVDSLRVLGLANPRLTIRHVGSRQIDVRQLTLGDAGDPDLIIPSLAADFSLIELLHGRVEKIEITGMKLQVTAGKGGITVKGLEALFKGKKTGKLTLPVHRVHIVSSLAYVNWDGRRSVVPFELQAVTDNSGGAAVFSAVLNPYADKIAINGALDLRSGDGAIRLESDQADIEKYLTDFNVTLFQWFRSRAHLGAEIKLNAWAISANRVSLSLPAFSVGFPGAAMTGALQLDCRLNREFSPEDIRLKLKFSAVEHRDFQIKIPFALAVSGSRLADLKFRLDDLRLQRPPGIAMKNFLGTASIQGDRLQVQGSFAFGVAAGFFNWLFPQIQMQGELAVAGTFRIAADGQGTTWNLKGAGRGGVALAIQHSLAKAAGLAFSFSAASREGHMQNSLDFEFRGVEGKYRDLVFSAKSIRCQGAMEAAGAEKWSAAGRLKIADATVTQTGGIVASRLFVDMPWRYPPAKAIPGKEKTIARGIPGNWRIASLRIGDLNLGQTAGEVGQKGLEMEFSGEARTPIEPVKIGLAGTCQWRDDGIDASLRFAMPETRIAENSLLKGLHPALSGTRCAGYLSASGNVSYAAGTASSQGRITIRDWDMAGDANGISCQGMNMTVRLRDLLNIRSEFSQRLDFKQLNISGLQLGRGDLLFEIDGSESLYIEGGEFAFSGGRILLQPLRYNFQDKKLKITMYSDRINFAEMLN